eukprot:SAG22_NODE_500_length_9715_cov_29.986793_2_plen_741_part_00
MRQQMTTTLLANLLLACQCAGHRGHVRSGSGRVPPRVQFASGFFEVDGQMTITDKTSAPTVPPDLVDPAFAERWCPRFHASKGTDPSGALILNGSVFIFPDASDDNKSIAPHHYSSRDLLHWNRHPMGWGADTGSVSVTHAGIFRMWPLGGAAGPIMRSELLGNDPALASWSAGVAVIPVPNGVMRVPVGNFRDPSRAVQLSDGSWFVAVGSDDGNRTGLGWPPSAQDGVAALRLYRAEDETLKNWSDMGNVFVSHSTRGYVDDATGAWSSQPVSPPPFLECPDLYRVGETLVLLASYNDFGGVPPLNITGKQGMSTEWRTGSLNLDATGGEKMQFKTIHSGVMDYGAFYAMKTAGDAKNPNSGRRIVFAFTGWSERKGGQLNSACGISHLMPRDLALDATLRMLVTPVPEIANLQFGGVRLVTDGASVTTGSQVMGNIFCRELQVGSGVLNRSVGFDVLLDDQAPNGGEFTRVGVDLLSGRLFVDQKHTNSHDSTLSGVVQMSARIPDVVGTAVSHLNLTVLVDGGLLETFANDRVVISSLLSPSVNGSSDADTRKVRAFGLAAAKTSCVAHVWKMKAVGAAPPSPGPPLPPPPPPQPQPVERCPVVGGVVDAAKCLGGFNVTDSTAALQAALNAPGAHTVIISNGSRHTPWITGPLKIHACASSDCHPQQDASNRTIFLGPGVIIQATRGGFKGLHDSLLWILGRQFSCHSLCSPRCNIPTAAHRRERGTQTDIGALC